jgi:F0F1-type ATP synthase delta subunit
MYISRRNLFTLRLYAVITVMIENDKAAAAAAFMVQLVKKSRLSWFEKIIKEFETIMAPTNKRIVRHGSFTYFR